MGDEPTDDPGWPPPRLLLLMLVPGFAALGARRQRGLPGGGGFLLASRWLYIAFASSTVLFGVVIATLRLPRTSAVDVRVAILATTAVAALVFDRVLTHKPLDCSSAPQLCRTYRERLFIHVAFAQSVALIAFLVQVGGGPKWLYLFGALCSEAELWTGHAPTRRALALDQARLDAAGCDLSLVAALRTTMPPRPGR